MKHLTVSLSILLAIAVAFGQVEKTELLEQADQLNEAKKFEAALTLLKKNESKFSNDPEFLWRLARAYFSIGDQNQDNEEIQKENYYPGFEKAKKCVEIAPEMAEGHQYYAILIGKIGELEGTKQKIKNSYQVKEHALRAIELDPENDSNYHVMGRWHYSLSELSWVEKKVAEMIYSELPEASFAEAAEFFKQAHQINPTDLRHILWLGKTYEELDKDDQAEMVWKKALSINAVTKSDQNIKNQIKKALN